MKKKLFKKLSILSMWSKTEIGADMNIIKEQR